LAVGIGASCANGEATDSGNHAGSGATLASAGAASAGTTGTSAGMGHGGMSTGGVSATAGAVAMAGVGSTAAMAGTGTGGGIGAGGALSSGGMSGFAGTGATAGVGPGGSAGSGTGGTGTTCSDIPPNNGDTCANAVSFGWCTQSWLGDSCQRSCGKCTGAGSGGSAGSGSGGGGRGSGGSAGSGTGNAGSGNSGNVAPPPDINGGQNAWASRYWDCCKPACGWTANVGGGQPMKACSKENQSLGDVDAKNACENGGSAFACWGDRPWSVGDKLAYGFAAASGGNYVCGRCYHLQFTGSSHNGGMNAGAMALNGKHMIIQVVNNGGVAADQFDLLIPGGGVGALNACSNQWGSSDLGAQYGGFLAGCNGDLACVRNKCNTIFGDKPDLMDGCEWFLGWFQAADNPNFKFERIACPAEITQRSGLSDR
jgi:hypothetical protein